MIKRKSEGEGAVRPAKAQSHMTSNNLAFHSGGGSACQTPYIGFLMERWNVERKFSLSAD